MKTSMRLAIFAMPCLLAITSLSALAQDLEGSPKHEVGLTLGALLNSTRSQQATRLELGPGVALQANYGYKFLERQKFALYGEVAFLANPQRKVSSTDPSAA